MEDEDVIAVMVATRYAKIGKNQTTIIFDESNDELTIQFDTKADLAAFIKDLANQLEASHEPANVEG